MYNFNIDIEENDNNNETKVSNNIPSGKENNAKSKLNQILWKYRQPKQEKIEIKNEEVDNILNNIESIVNKSKVNDLEGYINENKEDENENFIQSHSHSFIEKEKITINNANNSNYSRFNVSQIKKGSIYNNVNNDIYENDGKTNKSKLLDNTNNYTYKEDIKNKSQKNINCIAEIDVMDNLQFEVNKINKFNLQFEYSGNVYQADNYELFVYDPFKDEVNISDSLPGFNKSNKTNTNSNLFKNNFYSSAINRNNNINENNFNSSAVNRNNNELTLNNKENRDDDDIDKYINENNNENYNYDETNKNENTFNNYQENTLIYFGSKRNDKNPENYFNNDKKIGIKMESKIN